MGDTIHSEELPKRNRKRAKRTIFNRYRDDERFLNWSSAVNERWGQERLTQYIPVRQIDDLVGWATNIAGPQHPTPPFNPLLGLPDNPPRPSHLSYIHRKAFDHVQSAENDALRNMWQKFDASALISLGMVLEDMITASLLPLARAHVDRCRTLEEMERVAKSEWTLPPEEAIGKLFHDPRIAFELCSLPSKRDPTRSCLGTTDKVDCLASDHYENDDTMPQKNAEVSKATQAKVVKRRHSARATGRSIRRATKERACDVSHGTYEVYLHDRDAKFQTDSESGLQAKEDNGVETQDHAFDINEKRNEDEQVNHDVVAV